MTVLYGIVIVAGVLALTVTAALVVAGRTLTRLQRRAWAAGEISDPEQDDASGAVEVAFIALGLARQILLLGLVVQLVGAAFQLGARRPLLDGTLAALVVLAVFDKLLPYWLVAVTGGWRLLQVGAGWFRLVRALFGIPARYLSRTADRARAYNLRHGQPGERGDLGAFLDLAEEEGLVTESEEALLRGVADFEDTTVREVMTPRVDVVAIDANSTLGDLRQLIARHRYSRIPVVRDDLDHVVGIVNLKDLVAALQDGDDTTPVLEIVRPVWFVPESKRVSQLLGEFQRRQQQLAIVVDEYGGTAGLVTLEDVVEEIVGEIQDEDEQAAPRIEAHGDSVVVSGKTEIEEIEEALAVQLQDGDFHTVGGLVFTQLGHVPAAGEKFQYGPLQIEVLEADDRRIHRVRISAGG